VPIIGVRVNQNDRILSSIFLAPRPPGPSLAGNACGCFSTEGEDCSLHDFAMAIPMLYVEWQQRGLRGDAYIAHCRLQHIKGGNTGAVQCQ